MSNLPPDRVKSRLQLGSLYSTRTLTLLQLDRVITKVCCISVESSQVKDSIRLDSFLGFILGSSAWSFHTVNYIPIFYPSWPKSSILLIEFTVLHLLDCVSTAVFSPKLSWITFRQFSLRVVTHDWVWCSFLLIWRLICTLSYPQINVKLDGTNYHMIMRSES